MLDAVTMRTYDQFCPVAVALDVVGDRWTLLLLRDLLWHGPMRFSEIELRNPGLSTSLLSARLRSLEDAGLVEHIGGRSAGHYRLTEAGRDIRGVIDALYELGNPMLARIPLRDEMFEYVVRVTALRRKRELLELDDSATVGLDVAGRKVVVAAGPGRLEVATTDGVDATLRCSQEALVGILEGTITFDDAVESGAAAVDGDSAKARLVADLLRVDHPVDV